jgi:superfamily I DNA/RNA helicase
MIVLIGRVQDLGQTDLVSLEKLIESMFSDSGEYNTPNVVTFSSIHKAKGLEWDTVYFLGMNQFIPSKYAKQDWELEAEDCLAYVGITRARHALIHLTDCPARRNREEESCIERQERSTQEEFAQYED